MGYGNVKVHNGTLEYVFYVQGILMNFLSIYCASPKSYKFKAWVDKYVLNDIKRNYTIVSLGPIDHVGLYKFIGLNSCKNQPF